MKTLTITFVLSLCFALTMCGSKNEQKTASKKSPAQEAPAKTEKASNNIGYITYGDRTFHIKSAFALYDQKKMRLSINVFPFELTDKDLENLKKAKPYQVKNGKPSPDKNLWPDWVPYGSLDITFKQAPDKMDFNNIRTVNFYLNGMLKKIANDNKNIQGKSLEKISKMAVEFKQGGKITASVHLDSTYFKKKLIWKFDFNSTIHVKSD